MKEFVETLFGNQFFQLPFLEALSYIFALLLLGAIIVGLSRRALGVTPASHGEGTYEQRPAYHEEDTWEWRKAA